MKKYLHKGRGEPRPAFKPILKFRYHSLAKQLQTLLSRPDIVTAMRKHKDHLRRSNRNPEVKEDVQHGRIWSEMTGPNGQPFFTSDGDEIGLILTLDWYVVILTILIWFYLTGP